VSNVLAPTQSPKPADSEHEPVIDFAHLPAGSGVFVSEVTAAPSADGLLFSRRLLLPKFCKACYYAPFQKYAIDPTLDLWPEGYNQCHPLPLDDLKEAKRGGLFLIIELEDGEYLALLPVVTASSMAWFRGDADGLLLEAGHWGTDGWTGDLPLLGWAHDANLYYACERVWRSVLEHPEVKNLARMRSEKTYPEPQRYLGWCSWEEFKWDIGENILVDAIHAIDVSPAPIRWVLIDDGHIDEGAPRASNGNGLVDGQNGEVPIHESDRRLFSLEVNPQKFPKGWQPVMDARDKTKIRWMGVWLNFNGYWGGIHPKNALGSINDSLIETAGGALQPGLSEESSAAFYDALIDKQRSAGFDFIKVDNQAKNVTFYRGQVPNAVQATMENHAALEKAVGRNMETMINCMAHNNLCAFSSRHSQITRCSEDYKKGDLWRAKHHLNNSFANMLWLGQTVWGDHDMFHSSDEVANGLMARSKAISGGPIYLSDRPSNIRMDLVMPLCLEDGRLLQPLAPAAPLPESAFINTYEDEQAYRVIAPLSHGCTAIAAYNLTHPEKPVHGRITADDYRWAGGMLQDGAGTWELPPEGLIAFDVKQHRAQKLTAEAITFTIDRFDDRFFLLCPIRHGVAVIGREDKILSPQAVEHISHEDDGITLSLAESGPLLFWLDESKAAWAEQRGLQKLADGLWRLDLPVEKGRQSVKI